MKTRASPSSLESHGLMPLETRRQLVLPRRRSRVSTPSLPRLLGLEPAGTQARVPRVVNFVTAADKRILFGALRLTP